MGRLLFASLILSLTVAPAAMADTPPVSGSVPVSGAPVNRLIQVDTRLYRGGQPDAAGFTYLRDVIGIKTIVSLRNDASEQELVESLGMRFVNIPMTYRPMMMGSAPTAEAVARFFGVVDDESNGRVFLHCQRGADRTGTFVGLYRMARQGWNLDRAYNEAREVGMRWWYFPVKAKMVQLISTVAPLATPLTSQ
jgi:protein tyrosine phosphatase (PTP) superfamily phosphohydrolase (DUF442 family)